MQRRKNYLINKKFQFTFSSKFVVLLVLEALLISTLFFYMTNDTVTTGYVNSVLTVKTTSNFFSLPFFLVTSIVAVGVALAGMIVFILVSHRIAGPLYRFETALRQMQEGDLTKNVNLRKTDQLGEVQDQLNVLIRSLDSRLGAIKGELTELEKLLARRQDATAAEEIKAKIDKIRQTINHFKLTQESPNA